MNDTAITGNGRMLIEFKDEEELALTEHTRIYIDEVYYIPDPSFVKDDDANGQVLLDLLLVQVQELIRRMSISQRHCSDRYSWYRFYNYS